MYSVFIAGVRLPVTPSKISTKIKNMNKIYNLLEGGELNVLKAPGLTDIEFDALIPITEYPFSKYDGGFKGPDYFLGEFEKLKTGKEDFQFIVSRVTPRGQLFETNIRVSLEDYPFVESAESGGDFVVSIKLKQYVDNKVRKIIPAPPTETASTTETVAAPEPPNDRSSKKQAKTYKVKAGDTLWAICRKQLGNGNRYPEIAKLNKIANPNLIFPGQVIRFE